MPNIIETMDFGDGVERRVHPIIDSVLSTTSENPVQNKVITSQFQQLTNDITGLFDNTEANGAVNMLPNTATTQTINGVTFTVKNDGSIIANGTATSNAFLYILGTNSTDYKPLPNIVGKTVKLTGCPSGGSDKAYLLRLVGMTTSYIAYEDSGDGITFTVPNNLTGCYCYIYIREGHTVSNITFKPMLTVASYNGDYVPYTKSNKELTDDVAENNTQIQTLTNQVKDMNNVYGSKNLLSQKYMQVLLGGVSVGNKVESVNGLTIVYGEDGSIEINGTPSDSSKSVEIHFEWTGSVHDYNIENLAGKEVIASICDTSINGIVMVLGYFDSNNVPHQSGGIYSKGKYTYPLDAVYSRTYLAINGKFSYNHAKVYPMIRLASITDPTYEPYAKTNRQLTEDTASIESDISAINTQLSQLDFDGAGAHNSIYRGKYLGAEVTAEQYAHIADGTFKDMYIGDYWTIGGVNYRIGHFDYWYNTGDTACTTHHVLIVPDTNLSTGQMNSTNTTAGGYVGSDLKTGTNDNTALATAKNIITTAFGSAHILIHKEYFTNAVANGKPSGAEWYDSDIDLMNENMVYGTNIFSPHPDGITIPYLYTIDKTQIKLFAERPDLLTIRAAWWLRDVVSAAAFADVYSYGLATYGNASVSRGVRPSFGLRA